MSAIEWLSFYAAIPAAWGSAVLFVAVYSLLAPWWHNPLGRTIVALDGGIILTLLPHMLRLVLGVNEAGTFYAWFEFLAFMLVPASILWRTWILLRIHRSEPLLPRRNKPRAPLA